MYSGEICLDIKKNPDDIWKNYNFPVYLVNLDPATHTFGPDYPQIFTTETTLSDLRIFVAQNSNIKNEEIHKIVLVHWVSPPYGDLKLLCGENKTFLELEVPENSYILVDTTKDIPENSGIFLAAFELRENIKQKREAERPKESSLFIKRKKENKS